jgi:TolB-like protein/class 3 adenylate cyclase/Tfp pilus assembly protein PilF
VIAGKAEGGGVLATADIFLFEGFCLDRQRDGLSRRDKRGVFVPIAVGLRALDVLLVLVERSGSLVTKEEIMAAVWGRTVVENANLTVQISALRRVLDEGRTEGSCIQTVAARGYRFVAPVTRVEHAGAASTAGNGLEDTSLTRRLVAILAADVAGYARLIAEDNGGTLGRLKAHRRDLVDPKIAEYRGRMVRTIGDRLLVEFGSVVDAVRCAAEIQRGMLDRDLDLQEDRRIRFRIGVNLGEDIVEGEDIFGDGVNVATRLEALAEPGGVCVSHTVRDQIHDKLPYRLDDLGERFVKNIARPVRAYSLPPETVVGLPAASVPRVATPRRGRVGRAMVSAAAAVALIVVAGVAWWEWPARHSLTASAPAVSATQPAPRLSIVVLPFRNLGNDLDQQYFADGITEDLTTDLSRIPSMFVISRNSAFTYRNKLVETRQIGRELGMRYVLEGSVQRSGNQVRVNAQLVDAETGAHLWAERLDRDIGDLFALQSEITSRIAIALNLELVRAEAARPTDNPNAMDYIFKGRAAFAKGYSRESAAEAIPLFERALALDPGSVEAQSRLAQALVTRAFFVAPEAARTYHERAEVLIEQALASSPEYPLAHLARGNLLYQQRRCEDAIPEFEKVLAVDRNTVGAASNLGFCKFLTGGSAAETIELEERAIRLSPRDPSIASRYYDIGVVHLLQSRIDEAIPWLEKARRSDSKFPGPPWFLASAYGLNGELDRATAELAEAQALTRSDKYSTIAHVRTNGTLNTPATRDRFEGIFLVGLRKAGLPEE